MKHIAWGIFVVLSALAITCLVGCTSDRERDVPPHVQADEDVSEKAKGKSEGPPMVVDRNGPPPLVVDRNAPLLLDDLPKQLPPKPGAGPVADNSPCYVCHANYEAEEMVVVHAVENVGCIECHGKSYAHRDDENNVTPPDIMYAQDMIDESCEECHETHDAPAAEVVARWQERGLAAKSLEQTVCTDCHGEHRLKLRTVRWDKKTGELIIGGQPPVKAAVDYGPK